MPQTDHAGSIRLRAAIAAFVASALCWSCSGPAEPAPAQGSGIEDPPGAAAVLSIGGSIKDVGSDPFETAVNCAAALRVTSKTLAPMTSGANSQEMQMINRAIAAYRDRAVTAAGDDAGNGVALRAIEQRGREKAGDPGSQAQLSIACLRGLQQPA